MDSPHHHQPTLFMVHFSSRAHICSPSCKYSHKLLGSRFKANKRKCFFQQVTWGIHRYRKLWRLKYKWTHKKNKTDGEDRSNSGLAAASSSGNATEGQGVVPKRTLRAPLGLVGSGQGPTGGSAAAGVFAAGWLLGQGGLTAGTGGTEHTCSTSS